MATTTIQVGPRAMSVVPATIPRNTTTAVLISGYGTPWTIASTVSITDVAECLIARQLVDSVSRTIAMAITAGPYAGSLTITDSDFGLTTMIGIS